VKRTSPCNRAGFWTTIALVLATLSVRADQLQMQNGDRYTGKVVSVTEDSVVLQSDVLGKVTLPRNKIQTLNFGDAKAADPTPTASTTSSVPVNSPNAVTTNADLAAAFRRLGANTNFVQQVRQQMLTGSPQAAQKYDELVSGMMSGKLNLNDLRNQARASIDQMNELKRELGPEAGDALDDYLTILQNFVDESAPARTPVKPVTAPSTNALPVAVTGTQQTFRDTITK
jgi:hypothetical protein